MNISLFLYKGRCLEACPNKTRQIELENKECKDCNDDCWKCLYRIGVDKLVLNQEDFKKDLDSCFMLNDDKSETGNSFIDIENNKEIDQSTNKYNNTITKEYYFFPNETTGLLSACHPPFCEKCHGGIIEDTNGRIINMQCTECKSELPDELQFNNIPGFTIRNITNFKILLINGNCIPIIEYNKGKIIFNITKFEFEI